MEPLTKPRYFNKGITIAHIAVTALVIILLVLVVIFASSSITRAVILLLADTALVNIPVFIVGAVLFVMRNKRYLAECRYRETLEAIERNGRD